MNDLRSYRSAVAISLARATLLLCAFALGVAAAPKKLPEPRPVSDVERAATSIVASYLAEGAESVAAQLATNSPLRQLDHVAVLHEIEARLGPAKDAKWSLATAVPALRDRVAIFDVTFASGVDDTIAVEMIQEQGTWKIRSLHTAAEPVERPHLATLRSDAQPAAAEDPTRGTIFDPDVATAIGLPAALLSLAGIVVLRTRRVAGTLLLMISGLSLLASGAVLIVPVLPLQAPRNASPPPRPPAPDVVRLGGLVSLRNAIAAGDDAAIGTAGHAGPGSAHDVAALWEAQLRLQQERYADVHRVLAAFPPETSIMLVQLMRARLAFAESKEIDSYFGYQRAIDIGPGRDTLWIEAGEVLNILGLDEEAQTYLTRAAAIGSREPLMFYAAAQQAALDRREPDAEKLLMTAWHMRPIERGDVFAMQLLWQVLRQPSISGELKIADAAEASFASPATRPIVVPAGTAADVSGNDLRIRAGGGQLLVHGGAAIAPAGSAVIDAGAWRRDAEREALSRFAEEAPRTTPGALLQPTFRTRCFYTAAALADANRWADVLTLTAALPPHDERVPIALSVIRGKALTKMGRAGELRSLVIDLLSNPALKRKRDAPTMWMIAEMLAAVEEYDGAVKMLDHAKSRDDFPGLEQRVTQLLLEKKLAHSYSVITTAHLDIHYPAEVDTVSIQPLANIIEAEYVRLRSTWFPQTGERRVTVNILSWDDLRQYSGSDYVAGLYTNKVFLPLAGIQQFPPDIVALVTHELAHAFIADATHNLAPRWFHEALASHVEMHEQTNNAFRWYEEKRMISVALLDALANGSPDPEVVSETYAIGESTLRFIESRYGKASIRRMLDAFAAGADTEGAVHAVTGASVERLDADARKWGATQAVLFVGGQVTRYDGSVPSGMQLRGQQ